MFLAAALGPLSPGVYQTGSSLENVVFWLLVAIAIMMGAGLVLYLFFVRGSLERERQAALAIVGARRPAATGPPAGGRLTAPSYTYRGDVPDAVAEAMVGMRGPSEEAEVELVEEEPAAAPPAYTYPGWDRASRARPAAAPRTARYAASRPGRVAPAAPGASRYRSPSPLDDLLHRGDSEGLRDEDRELLREEQLEPEPAVPGLADDDEEVTFEDEPEPEPAYHPPAPRRISTRERPVWESILEAPADGQAGASRRAGRAPVVEEAEVELVDMDEPGAGAPVISKPVADELLRDSIMKSVKPTGPAWSEGRPVFSRPLEEPEVPRVREEPQAPDTPVDDALGDLSHRLRSMDRRAGPRLHPKAEAKMGVQEKKFLEALRAVQEKKHEEERAREEAGSRMLEEQMRELERNKRQVEARRAAERRRGQVRPAPPAEGRDAQMRRWEQARRATQERTGAGAGQRAPEPNQRGTRPEPSAGGRRRETRPPPEEPSSVDDVLSRIGIK